MELVTNMVGSQAGEKWETQLLATRVNHSPLGWKDKERRQCYWNLGVGFNRIQSHDGPISWLNGWSHEYRTTEGQEPPDAEEGEKSLTALSPRILISCWCVW